MDFTSKSFEEQMKGSSADLFDFGFSFDFSGKSSNLTDKSFLSPGHTDRVTDPFLVPDADAAVDDSSSSPEEFQLSPGTAAAESDTATELGKDASSPEKQEPDDTETGFAPSDEQDPDAMYEQGMSLAMGEWESVTLSGLAWPVKRLNDFHIAQSRYGGPIALLPQRLDNSSRLRVFQCQGKELWLETWLPGDTVVSMDWLDSEDLCVVLKRGTALLYSSNGSSCHEVSIVANDDPIVSSVISGNSLCALTRSGKVLVVDDLLCSSPKVNSFSVWDNPRSPPRLLTLLSVNRKFSKFHRPVFLASADSSATNDSSEQVFYATDQGLHAIPLTPGFHPWLMCEHLSGAFIAAITFGGDIEVYDSEFKGVLVKYHLQLRLDSQILQMFWVGELEVLSVLVSNPPWQPSSDGSLTYGLILLKRDGGYRKFDFGTEFPYLLPEIDGIRVLLPYLLQSDCYSSLHRTGTFFYRPCHQLHDQLQNPKSTESLVLRYFDLLTSHSLEAKDLKPTVQSAPRLVQSLKTILDTALQSFDLAEQKRYMSCVSSCKQLTEQTRKELTKLCKDSSVTLRILNSLRHETCCRHISHREFEQLQPHRLLSRLIHQGFYDEAMIYAQSMHDFPKSILRTIISQWYKHLLSENDGLTDSELENKLIQMMSRCPWISFADAAYYFNEDRPEIAEHLIDWERFTRQKVLGLLRIGKYDKALALSCETHDVNLIYASTLGLKQELDEIDYFKQLIANKEALHIVLSYTHAQDRISYAKVLSALGFTEEMSYLYLEDSFNSEEVSDKLVDLQQIHDSLTHHMNCEYDRQMIAIYMELLRLESRTSQRIIGDSFLNALDYLLVKQDSESAMIVKSFLVLGGFSEQQHVFSRIFACAKFEQTSMIPRILEENKQTITINDVAMIFLHRNNTKEVKKLLPQLPSSLAKEIQDYISPPQGRLDYLRHDIDGYIRGLAPKIPSSSSFEFGRGGTSYSYEPSMAVRQSRENSGNPFDSSAEADALDPKSRRRASIQTMEQDYARSAKPYSIDNGNPFSMDPNEGNPFASEAPHTDKAAGYNPFGDPISRAPASASEGRNPFEDGMEEEEEEGGNPFA